MRPLQTRLPTPTMNRLHRLRLSREPTSLRLPIRDFLIDRRVAIAGGFSETRNPTLMRMLGLRGATDRAGSGLQMMWKAWHDIFDATPVLDEFHAPSYVRLSLPLDQGLGNNGSSQKGSSHDGPLILLLSSHPEGVTTADARGSLAFRASFPEGSEESV